MKKKRKTKMPRAFWTRNPMTRIKINNRKENQRKMCRRPVDPRDTGRIAEGHRP